MELRADRDDGIAHMSRVTALYMRKKYVCASVLLCMIDFWLCVVCLNKSVVEINAAKVTKKVIYLIFLDCNRKFIYILVFK